MLSTDAPGAFPPCPSPFNLAAHVLAAGAADPARTALMLLHPEGRGEDWTHAQIAQALRGIGTGLLGLGLSPGNHVLLRLGHGVAVPLAFLGAIAVGLMPVPTSAALTAGEITALCARLSPALVIAGEGVALPDTPCPVLDEATLMAMTSLPPCDWAMGPPDRPAYAVFTSGTSGRAQGVLHAHRAIWARGMMRAGWDGMGPGDRVLHAGALNWTFTLGTGVLDPLSVGATAMIPAAGTPIAQLADLAARHKATIFAAAPGVYRKMLKRPLPPLPHLRHALAAGEALPVTLAEAWRDATSRPILTALGLSECSTFVSAPPDRPLPAGATGFAQPGRRVAVLGPDYSPVLRGTEGILAVHRGDPGLMLGYLGDPAATSARFAGDWFLTGDVVRMAECGAISHVGRDDDMLNPGGFRISPAEVEAAFSSLPGISELAVTEWETPGGATVLTALYVATEALDTETLSAEARHRLADWKRPRHWVHVPALPRNANGKLDRRALRDLARKEGA